MYEKRPITFLGRNNKRLIIDWRIMLVNLSNYTSWLEAPLCFLRLKLGHYINDRNVDGEERGITNSNGLKRPWRNAYIERGRTGPGVAKEFSLRKRDDSNPKKRTQFLSLFCLRLRVRYSEGTGVFRPVCGGGDNFLPFFVPLPPYCWSLSRYASC